MKKYFIDWIKMYRIFFIRKEERKKKRKIVLINIDYTHLWVSKVFSWYNLRFSKHTSATQHRKQIKHFSCYCLEVLILFLAIERTDVTISKLYYILADHILGIQLLFCFSVLFLFFFSYTYCLKMLFVFLNRMSFHEEKNKKKMKENSKYKTFRNNLLFFFILCIRFLFATYLSRYKNIEKESLIAVIFIIISVEVHRIATMKIFTTKNVKKNSMVLMK